MNDTQCINNEYFSHITVHEYSAGSIKDPINKCAL